MEIRWVGLAEGTKERGEGTTGRGMNDEDNEWGTQAGSQHVHGGEGGGERGRRDAATVQLVLPSV